MKRDDFEKINIKNADDMIAVLKEFAGDDDYVQIAVADITALIKTEEEERKLLKRCKEMLGQYPDSDAPVVKELINDIAKLIG